MSPVASPSSSAFASPRGSGRTAALEKTVEIRNVRKRFKPGLVKSVFGARGVDALQGVDLSVYRGEIFGLLGPNGAGKSTLVKILLGLVRPTTLEGDLLGAPVGRRQTMSRVGYLPEQHRFPPYLTGRQVVEFFSALGGIDRRQRKQGASELLDRVGMTGAADRRVNTYSKGMRQRIGLAQALASSPELIILDEPTDGVDPVARRDIRDVLVEARRTGASVLVNSHLLGELELICDRVAILVQGKVARQGTIDELALGSEFYEIELAQSLSYQQLGALLNITWDGPIPQLPRMGAQRASEAPGAERAPDALASDRAYDAPGPERAYGASGPERPHPDPERSEGSDQPLHPPPAQRPPLRSPARIYGATSAFALKGHFGLPQQRIALIYDPNAHLLRLETIDLAPATAALDALRAAGQMIRRFAPVRPTLEDLFFSTVTAPDGTVAPPR